MPPSDYLNTCTNIPALPSGWNWYLSTVRISRESFTRPGLYRDWTDFHISIVDSNNLTLDSATSCILDDRIGKSFGRDLNAELVATCYKAYNSMYPESKLNIHEALKYA